MKHPFFHDLKTGQCKFVLYLAPHRITKVGITHKLAVACGMPIERMGQSYCEAHRPGMSAPPLYPLKPPRDPRNIERAAPADKTPLICEAVA